MKDDRTHLQVVLQRIQRIERYVQGGQTEFFHNELIQDAVILNFQVIGEAVKCLSIDVRQRYPDIPWRQIAGFRDVLIHNFMGISLTIVWNAVEQNLPELKRQIERILREWEDDT